MEAAQAKEETVAQLQARHKQEQKELLAKTLAMRKSVPPTDKKGKKQVNADIAQMEADLQARHEKELAAATVAAAAKGGAAAAADSAASSTAAINGDTAVADASASASDAGNEAVGAAEPTGKEARKSKTLLRREKKDQQARERNRRIQEAEPELGSTRQEKEMAALTESLSKLGFGLRSIPADGNCLFQAVAVQVPHGKSAAEMRKTAADYMRLHADDFMPFLTNYQGDMMSPDEFEQYCQKMESTAEWGGEHEIVALAKALKRPIQTFQAHGSPHVINEEAGGEPIRLSYHQHQFGLGAHYNAVVPT